MSFLCILFLICRFLLLNNNNNNFLTYNIAKWNEMMKETKYVKQKEMFIYLFFLFALNTMGAFGFVSKINSRFYP